MDVDITKVSWRNYETGTLNEIINLSTDYDIVLVWYKDKGTGDIACMSADPFLLAHEAVGFICEFV